MTIIDPLKIKIEEFKDSHSHFSKDYKGMEQKAILII
jgi:hypothetical protein